MNKNSCSFPHTRFPELENAVSLAFPYEELTTQKHVSRRSYQDENTYHSVCLYTLVSDACEAALSKQSSGNPLEGGQALPPTMTTAALRSPSCSDDPLCKGL